MRPPTVSPNLIWPALLPFRAKVVSGRVPYRRTSDGICRRAAPHVEETDPKLSVIRLRVQRPPEVIRVAGAWGYSRVPGYWEPPGRHSRDSTPYDAPCDALQSLLSVARGGGDPWRGALYDAPHPLLSVAGGGVANSVARRNVIRRQASEPHGAELEHKTRQKFQPMRKR